MRGSELIYEFDLKSASWILALGGSCAVVLRTRSYMGGGSRFQPTKRTSELGWVPIQKSVTCVGRMG